MPSAEALAEPMRSRWSPSVFDADHELTREQIETLLHAAQWAPSYGNTQPWSFLVAERDSASHRVLVAHLSHGNSRWVPRASVVFVTAAWVAPDEHGNELKGAFYACHDLGQAAAHLTLQARAMGLHAHQFGGFDREAVAAELGVPAHFRVMTGIAVGVRGNPDEVPERDSEREQRERRRRPLAEFAYGASWGHPWPDG
jgi:nitroreductase